jgi:hypothetical protein
MTIFAVTRRGDAAGPLLLLEADDADEAIAEIQEQEEIGTLSEIGYDDSPDGYQVAIADEQQKALWAKSVRAGIEEGMISPDTDDPDWLTFLRPPEFEPTIEDDEDDAL